MNAGSIEREFQEKVSREIRLVPEGLDRYLVLNPFMFDDGDHFPVVLRRETNHWILTDEGHTFMHMSYDEIDFDRGNRKKIIDNVLANFRVENREGELRLVVPGSAYGDVDYFDQRHDPDGKYVADCRVNGMVKPLFAFFVPNDDRCRDATITCLQFEKLQVSFRSLAVFEDQEEINRGVLARFSDVCEKQFSSLPSNRDRIERYLEEVLAG